MRLIFIHYVRDFSNSLESYGACTSVTFDLWTISDNVRTCQVCMCVWLYTSVRGNCVCCS